MTRQNWKRFWQKESLEGALYVIWTLNNIEQIHIGTGRCIIHVQTTMGVTLASSQCCKIEKSAISNVYFWCFHDYLKG